MDCRLGNRSYRRILLYFAPNKCDVDALAEIATYPVLRGLHHRYTLIPSKWSFGRDRQFLVGTPLLLRLNKIRILNKFANDVAEIVNLPSTHDRTGRDRIGGAIAAAYFINPAIWIPSRLRPGRIRWDSFVHRVRLFSQLS